MKLEELINIKSNQIAQHSYQLNCKEILDRDGAIVIHNFITAEALNLIRLEG